MEEWKDIQGYEGLYQISNYGRVKSLNYKRSNKEKIMDGGTNKNGYRNIILSKNKKKETFYIHKLVAQHFISNPDNLSEINHIDENKSNNNVDNLEWCTHKYNSNYGTRNTRMSKSKGKKIRCITTNEIFESSVEASEIYNIDQSSIIKCCRGKQKTAGKLFWEYV